MEAQRVNDSLARISLRPIGSPLPLGLLALAVATLALAGLQLSGYRWRSSATPDW